MHVKRTKSKQKQNQVTSHLNWPRALLFDLAQKQCTGIIKGWLHCLMSESKGRFLVNNILMLAGHCLNPIFFNKKIKIGRPKYSLSPHPSTSITSHFCLNCPPFPPPPQSGCHMCITTYVNEYLDSENYWFYTEIKKVFTPQSSLQAFKRYISDMTFFRRTVEYHRSFCHSRISLIYLIHLSLPNLYFYTIRSIAMFLKVLNKVNFKVLTQT